jgi:TPR repeat protein
MESPLYQASRATVTKVGQGHLGDLYGAGTGTAKNQAKATEMWTKACEGGKGSRSACEKVGIKPKK